MLRRPSLHPWWLLLVVFAIATSACAGCGVKAPTYDYSQEPDPRNTEYVLGIGDVVAINVWQNEGLTTEGTIRPDGTITMPLVGDLKAVGETPSSLKAMIKARLDTFQAVDASEITVAVTGANSYRFTVSGEVTRPGIFTSGYYVTVAEAIALAGGFTRFGKRNSMVLMRRDDKTGDVRQIPLVYDMLANGSRPDMNLVLLTGDSLYVP